MLWRMRNVVKQPPASEQRSVPLAAAASAVANSIKGVFLFFTWPLKCIISKLKCSRKTRQSPGREYQKLPASLPTDFADFRVFYWTQNGTNSRLIH